jgi:hypothetical protein
MVTLEVGLDATKLVGGARDAFSALVGITNAARQALEGIERIGGNAGAFASLGTTISRVMPFITSGAAVIAAITASMSLFAKATSEATDGYKKLGDTLRNTSAEVDVAKLFGDQNLSKNVNQRNIGALFQQAVAIKASGSSVSLSDFAGQLGPDVGLSDLLDALQGDSRLAQTRRDVIGQGRQARLQRGYGDNRSAAEINQLIGSSYQLTPSQQIDLLRRRALSFGLGSPGAGEATIRDGIYPGPGQLTDGFSLKDSIGQPFNGVRIGQDDQSKINIENMQRAMADIERSSQRVGQYLGDAATALVTGAASWRDIAQQVIQDLIRSGLTQGFTAVTKSFLSGFGSTPAQTTT